MVRNSQVGVFARLIDTTIANDCRRRSFVGGSAIALASTQARWPHCAVSGQCAISAPAGIGSEQNGHGAVLAGKHYLELPLLAVWVWRHRLSVSELFGRSTCRTRDSSSNHTAAEHGRYHCLWNLCWCL
jgi:hypothetical protein